ncbi:MAG TPA: hypothetical protein G4O15_12240 [Dehalococcoidia bacterium]|nr:hypothetical protein [Dehalococcoidia bacterium]
MGVEENKEVVRKFVNAMTAGDGTTLKQLATTDFILHIGANVDIETFTKIDLSPENSYTMT